MSRPRGSKAGKRLRGLRRAPRPSAAPRMARGAAARARGRPITPELLRALKETARELRARHQVPGLAYAIVQEDRTVATECLGCLRTDEHGECPAKAPPVTPDTVFGIGSLTKSFTATQLALLVEAGRLRWDTRVRERLDGFALHDAWVSRELRVSDILTHRSGLPEYCLHMMTLLGFERQDILRALRHVAPVTSFRGAFAYQNTLALVAARLIEQETGRRWEDALVRQLLEPLGMSSSTADPKVLAAWRKDPKRSMASGHLLLETEEGGQVVPLPEDWLYGGAHFVDAPAGALYSSVRDMARWMRFHLGQGTFEGKSLLGEESLAYLRTPRTPWLFILPARAISIATGWAHDSGAPTPTLWHGGATPTGGMQAFLGLIPEERTGMVVLSNLCDPSRSADVPGELYFTFHQLFLGGARPAGESIPRVGPPPVFRPRAPRAEGQGVETDLSRLRGTYVNPAYGAFQVKRGEDGLVLVMGPRKLVAPLEPVGEFLFLAHLPEYGGDLPFQFILDRDGRATELRNLKDEEGYHAFGDVLQGVFLRRER